MTNEIVPVKKTHSRKFLAVTSLFISLLALIGVIFLLQQDYMATKELRPLPNALEGFQTAQTAHQTELQTLQTTVNSLSQQQQKDATYQNWATAGYLTRLADVEWNVLHNPQLAQQLLISADAALTEDTTARGATLKIAINGDLSQLNQLSQTSTAQTLQQIDALNQQVVALTIADNKQFHVKMPAASDKTATWWERVKHNLGDFKNLVVIHNTEDKIQPLLSNQELPQLKAAIGMQLGLAQWALATQQQTTYQNALTQAANWLTQFIGQNTQAQTIAKNLMTLAQQPLMSSHKVSLTAWPTWDSLNKKN